MRERFSQKTKAYQDQKGMIAYSGGLDSSVLLNLGSQCLNIIGLIHICHHLRPNEELEKELHHIRWTAANYNIPVYIHHLDPVRLNSLAKTFGVEAAARKERYEFFEKFYAQCDYILTAHHQDDLLETELMGFIRGRPYSDLASIIENEKIHRPLLNFTRSELETFALKNQITFSRDTSNDSLDFLRNKIRHQIIPKLLEIAPGILKSRFQAKLRSESIQNHFESFLEKLPFEKIQFGKRLSRKHFDDQEIYIKEKIIYKMASLFDQNLNFEISHDAMQELFDKRTLRLNLGSIYIALEKEYLVLGSAIVGAEKNGYIIKVRRGESYHVQGFGSISLVDEKPEQNGRFLHYSSGEVYLRPLTRKFGKILQSLIGYQMKGEWIIVCSDTAWYAISKDARIDAVCIKADQKTINSTGLWILHEMEQ